MEQAEAFLKSFPDPVTLYPSPLKWLLLFIFGISMGGYSLYCAITGNVEDGFERVIVWIAGPFFLGGSPLILLRMRRDRNSLTLTREGFEWRHPRDTGRHSWNEVSDFTVYAHDLLNRATDTGSVQFRRAPRPDEVDSDVRNGSLSDTYGLGATELAWLMSQWQSRALAGKGQEAGPS